MAKKQPPRRAKEPSAQQSSAKKGSRQLVVTLNTASGGIEKIEELGVAGKRRVFSEAEFAKLAGDSSLQDVCEALEAAYMAGIQDGFDDAQPDELLAGASEEQQGTQETFGEDVLRAGIRQIIFRRALRRRLEHAGGKPPQNGAQGAR